MILSLAAVRRLGWSLDSPLTIGKVKFLLDMQEKFAASNQLRTTPAQSKASEYTEQELAIAKEVAAVSLWDFNKFVRSGNVDFLLAQARLREQATPAEIGWDSIIRNVYPDGAVGAFTLPPREVKLLPVLSSRLASMREICSTLSVGTKDPLYLVAIGPYQWAFGLPLFLISFHLVAMTEASLRAFYKCFREAEMKHRRSSLPFSDEWYRILAIHPLSAPHDQRDLQFVHELVRTFQVCNEKPLPVSWSERIVRIKSSSADTTLRKQQASSVHYEPFADVAGKVKLSVSPVCFLTTFCCGASALPSIKSDNEVTHAVVKGDMQLVKEHPVRIHQDLVGQLLPIDISNPSTADDQIGILMYHPDCKMPTDESTDSYAYLRRLCALGKPTQAGKSTSSPHVTHLLRVELRDLEQSADVMHQKLRMLHSRGWLLGGVAALRPQQTNASAPLTDILIRLFASELFNQHVRPMVQLPLVSVVCIILSSSALDNPVQVHPISISSYVVPTSWLLPAGVPRSTEDWKEYRTDRELWYSVAPLEKHPDFSEMEATAGQAPEVSTI